MDPIVAIASATSGHFSRSDFDPVLEAQRRGYFPALRNLAERPEAAGRSVPELLAALVETRGLVYPARRLLSLMSPHGGDLPSSS